MDEYINKTKFEELMRKKARSNFDLYYADKSKRYHAKAIGYTMAADEAHVFPSADVQPLKRGTWIIDNDYYTCSRCNHQYLKDKILSMTIYPSGGIPYYCPCCGADMRGEQK